MAENFKIMVVEDETWSAMLIENYLIKLGYQCPRPVATGSDAVKLAGEENPDLIFMDIRLADSINGIEAARMIVEKNPGVFIAFMSAFQDYEVIEEAKKINCVAYFNKPLDMDELKEIIGICEKNKEENGRCMA